MITLGRKGVGQLPASDRGRAGAGDAIGGSFCHGLLSGWPLGKVLQYADATVACRPGYSTDMPTLAEIETLLAGGAPMTRPGSP